MKHGKDGTYDSLPDDTLVTVESRWDGVEVFSGGNNGPYIRQLFVQAFTKQARWLSVTAAAERFNTRGGGAAFGGRLCIGVTVPPTTNETRYHMDDLRSRRVDP